MRNTMMNSKLTAGLAVYLALSAGSAWADDTEIFFGNAVGTKVRPNVLFIFDTSGSMKDAPNLQSSEPRKIDAAKDAMRAVLDQVDDINVGLMRFSGDPGGPVLYPVKNVDDTAVPKIVSRLGVSAGDASRSNAAVISLNSQKLEFSSTYPRVGLRFPSIEIPQGATITRAAMGFTRTNDSDSNSVNLVIRAQNAANTADFTAGDGARLTAGAQSFATTVAWSPASDNSGHSGRNITTPELKTLIQEVVNQGSWVGGNALTLFVDYVSGSGIRKVYSWDGIDLHSELVRTSASNYPNYPWLAPTLYIEWTDTFGGSATKQLRKREVSKVRDAKDDVEERDDGTLELVPGQFLEPLFGNHQALGVRFSTVRVPKAATITSALLKLKAGQPSTGAGSVTYQVKGVLDANFAGFPLGALPVTGQPATTAATTWSPGSFASVGAAAQIDVKTIVTELVNQGSWDLGNAMAFTVKTTSGTRNDYFSSVENNGGGWVLEIDYQGAYTSGTYTHRDDVRWGVEDFIALGATPISDSLAEAGRYYRGAAVETGKTRGKTSNDDRWNAGMRVSSSASLASGTASGCSSVNPNDYGCANEAVTSGTYKSPITEQCQSSHIVLVTDGDPTIHNSTTNTFYSSLAGGATCATGDNGMDCSHKLAEWYAKKANDMGTGVLGNQRVQTHVIGFAINNTFMQVLASKGEGKYTTANTADDLVGALLQIADEIDTFGTSFVSAGVSVNQTNRLTHSDRLYFALFLPEITQRWPGNLKQYRLDGGDIKDMNNNNAVALGGYFDGNAHSYWSAAKDGDVVAQGGAASKLTATRTVYSNVTATADLTVAGNRVVASNSNIVNLDLGVATSTERTAVLDWAQGIDVDDLDKDGSTADAHNLMGDPLHSQPVVVRFKESGVSKTLVMFGTNNGYLHVIDTEDGTEKWSFVPKPLLKHLRVARANGGGSSRAYGLDGTPTVYQVDKNLDGVIEPDAGDKAILVIGERRGGNRYYAIDISRWASPKMLYTIEGGAGAFAKMGQSWSRPIIADIKVGGVKRTAIFLGGGYDPVQDNWAGRQTSVKGNAVYLVDLFTGAKLWDSGSAIQASVAGPVSAMSSVPGDIAAIDLDGDGLIDNFYAVDTNAQIFRFDVVGNDIRGGRLAALQTSTAEASNRRFYYSPSVALSETRRGKQYIAIAVGSGFREHPLDENVEEQFYGVRDFGVLGNSFDKDLALSDLVDVTNIVGDGNNDGQLDATVAIESAGKHGWYIDFWRSGEKVLNSPVIYNNKVYFTTYMPASVGGVGCTASTIGSTSLWIVSLDDGNPIVDKNLNPIPKKEERYKDHVGAGIAPLALVMTEKGVQVLVGNNAEDDFGKRPANVTQMKWWKAQ